MKKIIMILLVFASVVLLSGCDKEDNVNKAALAFKEEYESLNGKTNAKGAEHRSVTISEDNPFEKITTKELIEKIENDETLYVYFGDRLCPWCRSVIEKAIEVANAKIIKKIYYIKIWDDEGKEVLRDKYEIVDKKLTKTIEGTEDYYKLLNIFDSVLSEYNVTDSKGKKVSTNEKRIYAPNFIFVEKGEVKTLVEGISEKQTESRATLTEEMLADEKTIFEEFFSN